MRRVNPRKCRKAESFHFSESIVAVEGAGCIADFTLYQAGFVGLWHLQAYNTIYYEALMMEGLEASDGG